MVVNMCLLQLLKHTPLIKQASSANKIIEPKSSCATCYKDHQQNCTREYYPSTLVLALKEANDIPVLSKYPESKYQYLVSIVTASYYIYHGIFISMRHLQDKCNTNPKGIYNINVEYSSMHNRAPRLVSSMLAKLYCTIWL